VMRAPCPYYGQGGEKVAPGVNPPACPARAHLDAAGLPLSTICRQRLYRILYLFYNLSHGTEHKEPRG